MVIGWINGETRTTTRSEGQGVASEPKKQWDSDLDTTSYQKSTAVDKVNEDKNLRKAARTKCRHSTNHKELASSLSIKNEFEDEKKISDKLWINPHVQSCIAPATQMLCFGSKTNTASEGYTK